MQKIEPSFNELTELSFIKPCIIIRTQLKKAGLVKRAVRTQQIPHEFRLKRIGAFAVDIV